MMIKGESPRELAAQQANVAAENLQEWLARYAETGKIEDLDKVKAKMVALDKAVKALEVDGYIV